MELILKNWNTWMWSASILAAAILIALSVHTVLFFVLKRLARRKGEVFVNSLLAHGQRPARWILPLLAEGKSSKEVASSLRISIKTVETHRSNAMQKLEIHNVSELVRYAVRNQIVEA